LLTRSDRPTGHYGGLKEHIRRKAESGLEVWLITSRPQAARLSTLREWDRLIVDIEDPWFDLSWGSRVSPELILDALRNADAVFGNGEMIAREYARLSGRAVLSLPNGVDGWLLDALEVAGPMPGLYGGSPGLLRAVFMGNINDRLDYGILAKVAQAPGYHFYFIGLDNVPGKSRPEWEAIKRRNNFTWIPPVQHREIPAVLQHADVLLLPYYRTGHEKMFPAKLFEYAAAAEPIIATVDFTAGAFTIPTLAVCRDAASFLRRMQRLRETGASVPPGVAAECRALARRNTWAIRASELLRQASAGASA
jgi:glycosyltransferase involved in cell wall biosynthesis